MEVDANRELPYLAVDSLEPSAEMGMLLTALVTHSFATEFRRWVT